MHRRPTDDEWTQNMARSLDFLVNECGGKHNPAWVKALRSAVRVARDFDRNVHVMWNGHEYHVYGQTEHCTGNFDVCLPNGHIIH